MNKKIIHQFEEQFGKEWECSCKTPFGVSSLEIISESESSLLAHYICPNCGKEQMLAASISNDNNKETEIVEELLTLPSGQLTGNDVLDIRDEIKTMKIGTVRNLQRNKIKKEVEEEVKNLLPPKSP